MKYYICPSVLSADLAGLGADVRGLVRAGCEWIHVDIMDGHFVDAMTFGPAAVDAVRRNVPDSVIVDAHLMIEKPEKWVKDYCDAGADIVIAHAESTMHLHGVVQSIHNAGKKAGVTINPATPLCAVEDVLAP